MTRQEAINILCLDECWNDYDAEAIVDSLEEAGMLEDLTRGQLIAYSRDYMDR
jgi:hypothetical protein